MQICKLSKQNFFSKKITAPIFLAFIFCSKVSAQSMEMPQMPSMPEMPTIQSISSNGFYTPALPSLPKNPTAPASEDSNSSGNKKTETTMSAATSNADLLQTMLEASSSSVLSASDISSLYDSGLFSNLSTLSSSSSMQNYATSTQTNLLLQQMLNSLNELKAQQNNADAAQKTAMENKQADAQNFKNREPSILRFKINGYDIISSLTANFVSEQEADGTFLLTADRKYYVNQVPRTETFYMLFKAVSTTGNALTYKVQSSLTQDYKNENSFIYRMAQTNNMVAEKTGNLVVLHYSENGLSVDLLLDLDN